MKNKMKFIYDITHPTTFGIGCQPMKGNNKTEARERFKKRFPNKSILGIDKRESPLHSWNKAL